MTGPSIRIRDEGGIGVVEIDHPPVNALARPVRAALLEAVDRLATDPAVRAIVFHGCGRHFIAGADVREFDDPPAEPYLPELLNRIEALDKPVIAALHGTTLGGGAELALACHYRCATADLSFGFPEIKLGLLPGAGGTVRLPRLIGIRRSLELMTSGTPVGYPAARELGLVDHALPGDALAGALAFARASVAAGTAPRRTTDLAMPAPESPTVFAEARAALAAAARRVPASEAIIAAVEAAVALPWREALAVARERFDACRRSTESRALRHLFFAERVPAPVGTPHPVATLGVVGAGTMGSGIAIAAATAGLEVTLVDAQEAALAAGLERVARHFGDAHRKGRIDAAAAAAATARVRGATTLAALAAVDLVIEAVFESLEVKRAVFVELGRLCRRDAVLATNTSTLDVDAIAAASGRAGDVVGMHFFSPAHVMRLLEIVRGRDTAPTVLATAFALGKRLGKLGVVVGNGFGFVGNRMLYAYGREKELMMLEGATPAEVDRALEAFGMAMGPNAVGDLAGLDVGYAVRRGWRDRPDDPRFYRVSDLLVEHGRLGQKNGRGFYRYEPGARRGTPDPEVDALIRAEAARLGIARRTVGADEIVERCTLALIDEGFRLLEEGIAARASDIDLVWCHGYGFPRERGGPMCYADTLGLERVLERIRSYAATCGPRYWTPAAGLERLAHDGGRLADRPSAGAT